MNLARRLLGHLRGRRRGGGLALLVLLVLATAASKWLESEGRAPPAEAAGSQPLAEALAGRVSDVQVSGAGVVERVLPDDTHGSRHQRFILRLESGQTLLVAHNIDLAPRIPGLRVGDEVAFNGEYEWNTQGGVIHWTHHDPAGRHEDGWLRHQGRLYQ